MSAYHNPAGVPARVINLWRDEKIILCVSPAILDEYRVILFRFLDVSIESEIAAMKRKGFLCHPPLLPGCVPGDADDEKFLECAVVAKAGYVVSGDKHLLAQNGYRKVRVLKPADFARKLA